MQDTESAMERLVSALRGASRVGCLTGADLSTLCGIPDFRGPQGLYHNPDAGVLHDLKSFADAVLSI